MTPEKTNWNRIDGRIASDRTLLQRALFLIRQCCHASELDPSFHEEIESVLRQIIIGQSKEYQKGEKKNVARLTAKGKFKDDPSGDYEGQKTKKIHIFTF